MANTAAPFGFRPIRRVDGAAWSGNLTQMKLKSDNTNALNRGDCIKHLNTGYIDVLAAGDTSHDFLGVFMGCHYLVSALGYPIWSNYWPGSGNTGDVDVFICDDVNVVFEVQANSTGVVFADIGLNADVTVVASTTGFSKWTIGNPAVTATFPWRIYQLGNNGVNVGNGYDGTSGNNVVEVVMNDQFYRQTTGI